MRLHPQVALKSIRAIREIWLGRKIWLSPVIQATWEARVVGWLEVERPLSAVLRIDIQSHIMVPDHWQVTSGSNEVV
jgi:hypothetical protein